MNIIDLLNKENDDKENVVLTECRICGEFRPRNTNVCPNCGATGRIITLSEWGERLPIGIYDDKNKILNKDFKLDKINWEKERDISTAWNIISSKNNLRIVDYVLCVLGECINTLSGVNFQKHNAIQRNLILREMFIGDIFYLYLYLRVLSLGNEYTLRNLVCPSCEHKFNFIVDLSTTDISVIDSINDIYTKVKLEDGFELMGKLCKVVTLKPTTFNSLMSIDSKNEAEIWAKTIQGCVTEIEGAPPGTIITEKEISKFTKTDMDIFNEKIDLISGGPDWSIELTCKECSFKYTDIIDWQYSNFFKRSFQSKTRRRR